VFLTKTAAEKFLSEQGEGRDKIDKVLSGFDFCQAVYIQKLEEGDEVYQYMRTFGYSGNWLALKGASMEDLAIFSGNEGRVLKKVRITYPCAVLEGIAKSIPRNWKWSYGGLGGGTQMYMPSKYIFSYLEILGPVKHA
jgi:hypothetical protein